MKFLEIKKGLFIKKSEIAIVYDDPENQFGTTVYTTMGNAYITQMNSKAIVDLLEKPEPVAINPFEQHNVG